MYVLAIDGGGTKTQVVCADQEGQILGEGLSGPTSLAVINPGAAGFNLREAVRQAIEQLPAESEITRVVMGLAGMDTHSESEIARKVFFEAIPIPFQEMVIVNDIIIALESGSDSPNALALISGTGSNCFGHNEQGQTAKTGGMDYLLSDQGSGYAIGRAVLRRALASFDGREPKTMLEQFVCEHFRIVSISELKTKVTTPPLTKTEVAELAQVCLRAFDQGDATAHAIFDHAAQDLSLMASTVIRRLELQDKPTDCVLAGSITKFGYIQTHLDKTLHEVCPQLNLVVPEQAPVMGALKLALGHRTIPSGVPAHSAADGPGSGEPLPPLP